MNMRTDWGEFARVSGLMLLVISLPLFNQVVGIEAEQCLGCESSVSRDLPEEFEWRMHRFDSNRTGFSPVPGPITSYLLWSRQLNDSIVSSAAVADGMVFVGTLGGVFYALDMTSGEVVWSFKTNSSIYSSPAVIDGEVYFAAHNPGKIFALDEFTGLVQWTFEIPGGATVYSSPVIANGKLFIGSSDGYVRALTQSEGALIWDFYISHNPVVPAEVHSSPAVANGMVFVGSSDGVCALDELNGTRIWNFDTRWQVVSTPAVGNGMVFVGAENDDKTYVLNETTGRLVWSYYSGGWFSSPAIDLNKNLVIVNCKDRRVHCLDMNTGMLLWKTYIPGVIDLSSPAISGNGYVYFGSTDRNVYCLNETSGQKVWSHQTGDQVISSPSIVKEHIFIGSVDGNLYCFGPPYPVRNVAVSNITLSTLKLRLGHLLDINYTVENKGNIAENVTIRVAYNNSELETVPENLEQNEIHIETITIESKANYAGTYTWNTTEGPVGRNSIIVHASLQIEETDVSDNTYIGAAVTIILPADLNEDGEVDIMDIVTISTIFGSGPGDPEWNPNTDFDNNSIIDIFDIVQVTKEFGRAYL